MSETSYARAVRLGRSILDEHAQLAGQHDDAETAAADIIANLLCTIAAEHGAAAAESVSERGWNYYVAERDEEELAT